MRWLIPGFVLCLLAAFPMHGQTPEDAPVGTTETLHVGTQLVLVDATVVSRKTGQAVPGLTADDFELREDGVPQTVTSVSQNTLPLSLVFLFDTTDTVHPVLFPLALGARRMLDHLRPEDEVAVMTFSTHAALVQKFTRDHARMAQGLADASDVYSKQQATFIFEDVYAATEQAVRATAKDSRRVEVWLTDGSANYEDDSDLRREHGQGAPAVLHTKRQATELLLRSGVVVSALIEKSDLTRIDQAMQHGRYGDVEALAGLTGGPVEYTTEATVVDRFGSLLDALRARYTLGYKPSVAKPAGTVCRLSLGLAAGFAARHPELRAKDVVVRTRVSYTR